jgi:Uma2 family endonuclease
MPIADYDSPPAEEVENGIHYPSTDGEPMGESDWHYEAISALVGMLRRHFAGRDVYVASNVMLYYEQGNPSAVRAPDCMVVLGVDPRPRRSWWTWAEGAVSTAVFEVASKGTYREDLRAKRRIYARIGIPEYCLFDPIAECRAPPLRGFQLVDGAYVAREPDMGDGLTSPSLGLHLYPEGRLLRAVDIHTHRPLLTAEEIADLLEMERERADLAGRISGRRLAAARRLAEEQRRLAEERQRLADERRRTDQLAAEVERLRALLGGQATNTDADPTG